MQENVNIPDSTITTNLSFRQLVLMNMQQLTNFPYIEKDFDALTDYELLCLVVKFLNDVIANQNEQNDSITRMYESFLALQDYVNNTKDTLEDAFNSLDNYVRNFFDNLDLQEEVDNKLDEMLEDGVLEQIIEQFLQSTAIWCFDTVADMKAATNLINGSDAKTLGYYAINDGGAGLYHITNVQSETEHQEELNSGLYATLITTDNIYVEQFGAYGDKTHDDKTAIENAINYGSTNHKNIVFSKKYLVNSIITINNKDGFRLIGNQQMYGHVTSNEIYAPNGFLQCSRVIKMIIDGLSIDSVNSIAIEFNGSENRWDIIKNCFINSNEIGINALNLYYSTIENCRFNSCRRAIVIGNNGTGSGDIKIVKCHFPNLTTAFYIDTDSLTIIDKSTTENVATIMYVKNGGVYVNDCYMSDGFRQGFIVENGNIHLNTVTQLVSTKNDNRPSEFGNDRCCIDLQNNSIACLNDVSFTEYYSDAPEIKLSNSASLFINNNVRFFGYYLLQTTQTNMIASKQQNYITGKTIEGTGTSYVGTSIAFKVLQTLDGVNYMGDNIYKYTNDRSSNWGMSFSYKVPKSGYYLFWLKLKGASVYDYDYVTFPSGCYVPSAEQMPTVKYRKTNSPNFTVNSGYENTIRTVTKNYPNSTVCVPIYIDENSLENSFTYYSQQNMANEEKTIEYIGITDFENPFCLPCFK